MAVLSGHERQLFPLRLPPWRAFSRCVTLQTAKGELTEALANSPADAELLIGNARHCGRNAQIATVPRDGELYAIKEADIIPVENETPPSSR
jgi:hypothetical protein